METEWEFVVHVCYHPEDAPDNEDTIDLLFDLGAHTRQDGSDDGCHYFRYDGSMDGPALDAPLNEALDQLRDSEGYLELWFDDFKLRWSRSTWREGVPNLPYHTLSFLDAARMRDGEFACWAARLVAEIADETGAVYAFGGRGAGEPEGHHQDADALLAGRLGRVFHLNYLSSRFVEHYGRDRVLTAPAALIDQRPSGAVLLMTALPLGASPPDGGRAAVADHLEVELPRY